MPCLVVHLKLGTWNLELPFRCPAIRVLVLE